MRQKIPGRSGGTESPQLGSNSVAMLPDESEQRRFQFGRRDSVGCRALPRERSSAVDCTLAAHEDVRPSAVSMAPRSAVIGLRTHSGGVPARWEGTAGPAWGTSRGRGVKLAQANPMCVQRQNARTGRIPPDGRANVLVSRQCAFERNTTNSGKRSTRIPRKPPVSFSHSKIRRLGCRRRAFESADQWRLCVQHGPADGFRRLIAHWRLTRTFALPWGQAPPLVACAPGSTPVAAAHVFGFPHRAQRTRRRRKPRS